MVVTCPKAQINLATYHGVDVFGFKAAPNNFAVTSTKGIIFS
jgi:hypothetical protein